MRRLALITGATSGIGEATAYALAKEGLNLILTARRAERLESIKQKLEDQYNIRVLTLAFDIRVQKEVYDNISSLPAEWRDISILINNAGLAVGLNSIESGVVEDWERMIDTNIKGLLYISRLISEIMKSKGSGHIVNIGSVAGKGVYNGGNVYCATKFAVDALSKSMLLDLSPYNIKVSQVNPGAVETEFSKVRFKGDEERASAVYKGFTPLTAEQVAEVIRYIVTAPPNVNLSDVTILPIAQASASVINKKEGY